MVRDFSSADPENPFAPDQMRWWRLAQIAVWAVGLFIVVSLLFLPDLGVLLLWNVLIPVAPLLLVLGAGVWRNICPLATTALLPRKFGFSRKIKLSAGWQSHLSLVGILALYLIVPLRHAFLNTDGAGSGILLIGISTLAFGMGYLFEWKSGWCNSLCPVHPVERLYSNKVVGAVPNAHCTKCMQCATPCPDSTPGITPLSVRKNWSRRLGGYLMVGGFPGFVWGWFQVPDRHGWGDWSALPDMYALPFAGAALTLVLYLALERWAPKKYQHQLIAAFAAAAVSCYYWYRLPALLGFGRFPNNGRLINLQGVAPAWSVTAAAALLVVFLFWWLVWCQPRKQSWMIRPEYG
jgi:hypothetical protein